jgi:hypothetical protein
LKRSDGAYLGTLIGKKKSSGLFSEIIVIKKANHSTDTLWRINNRGFWDRHKLHERVSAANYDGWNFEFPGGDYFDVWLVKIDGAASDGARIQWADSLKSFTISH